MNLYLDLNKAVQIPNTATDTVSDRQGAREYNESFARRSSGVSGEPDDKVREKPDNTDTLDDELEDDRKLDTQIAQERGIVEKPEETKKSWEGFDMLKSLTASLDAEVAAYTPNSREIEYLVDICGYTREDVMKGYATITGSERNRFNAWLQDELRKSIRKLAR